ncbi:hypothetical protein CHLRE_06g310000v5 [Chlamydomonas reinhardtii]|uniref:Clathrin/coatomer adaptor adaptin-like N-terminal domain-containing protein n=1 Tax=Chlamydomonas reinhardtii TaxID=3055 RepID=A0A2K3DRS2_CHLRE|nr:uncharacterized protein CHLRE_06g310000v5 [Chlamydomonas reinhardtii]PNW83178.1 hypothetical protein CHLRE_06g310000v5 [Chlamydomonas reinhardtii]
MALQAKFEKVVQGIKTSGPKFLKELREFDNLVKAIGECKSKAEEDRIITQELELLKQRLSDPKLDKSRGKEYMIRLIYCEMLGHDASFAYIKALQFASDPNIHTKKAAYLALTQFLDCDNQLVLLLVNTLLSDMKSDNYLIVCTALVTATKLIGADLVNAVYPVVVERLRHPKEHVRKKAVMALHWFGGLDPRREGPLAGVELDKHFRTMLCDKDPAVMSAALCALHECIKGDPRPYKNLIPSFTSILKQVSEHRLPKTYDYHRFPAPFIQIKLLKILAMLGSGDRASSENMAAVLHQTLRRANTSHTIGSAIIFECVRTITTIYPNPQLLATAAESIAAFLRSPSHNLRYVGIDALAGIVAINPSAAAEHQVAVLDCLEDPDDTLKLKTLELLYKMTKANNIQVIVEKMMSYLATCSDEHIRRDIVRKVSDLAERYAPSPSWFVATISEVFRLGGEHVDEGVGHGLCRLIAEQDASLHASAVEAYLGLLDGAVGAAAAAGGGVVPSGKKLPETILLVICWVLGEYGHLAARPPGAVLGRLMGLLAAHKTTTDRVRGALLTALAKLAAHTGGAAGPVGAALAAPHGSGGGASGGVCEASPADFVHACLSSQNLELQQRAHELTALLKLPPPLLAAALPVNAAAEDLTSDLGTVVALPFLDGLVNSALAAGAQPYLSPEARGSKGADAQAKGLRFEAYEPAPYAVPIAAASTSAAFGAGGSASTSAAADPRQSSYSGPSPSAASTSSAAAAAAAAGPSEPQLTLKGAGGRKWGPAQYESGPDAAGAGGGGGGYGVSSSGPSTTSAPAPAAPRSGHHSRNASGSGPALTGQAAERERLAASLFGGGGGGGGAFSAASRPAAAPAAAAARASGGAPSRPGAAPAAAAPAPNVMDMLLDLDVPPATQPAAHSARSHAPAGAPAAPGGDWMDSLLGGGGPAAGPGGNHTAAGMGMGGPGMGAGGIYGGMGPPQQQQYQQYQQQQQQQQPAYGGGMGGPGMGMGAGGMGQPGPGYGAPTYGQPQPYGAPAGGMGMGMGGPGMGMGAGMGGRGAPPPHQQMPQKAAGADPFGDLLG